MKDYKKIYGQFDIIKNSIDHGVTKVTYSSLDKYSKSPYLQKVIQHSTKKPISPIPINSSNEKQASQYSEKEYINIKSEEPNRRNNFHYQLPKLNTPNKLNEGQTSNYHKTELQLQERLLSKEKYNSGAYSATLDVNINKNLKLQPLQKISKINFVTKTKAGTNGKQTKINQDIAIGQIRLPFGLKLFGVCDGHGVNGHLVSAFIKLHLIKNLNNSLKKCVVKPEYEQMKNIINKALMKTNQTLLESQINTELSGSTVVCIFLYEQKIISFNVGDSRAILIKKIQNSSEIEEIRNSNQSAPIQNSSNEFKFKHSSAQWKTQPLSVDHKPQRQDQKKRILQFGGRIFSQKSQTGQQLGPLRVWMKDIMMPGLAMTRSFGDKAGIKAGTNGIAQILQFDLNGQQRMIVVASDGVWEYLENDQVMTLILPYYLKGDLDMAAERLIKIASEVWHKVSFSRDDITVVIASLNSSLK